jgi:L-threonylcarbamoyladenylate synthase
MLLKKSELTSVVVTGGLQTVGLRVPSHPLFLEVLTTLGTGLAAPSANRYKALSPTSAKQVVSSLDGRISAVLDGGPCEFGLESTIVDFTSEVPRIVRAGPLSRQYLQDMLGSPVDMPAEHDAIVPGNVSAHYQPRTPLRVVSLGDMTSEELVSAKAGFIVYSQYMVEKLAAMGVADDAICYLAEDAARYGKQLYASLFALDMLGKDTLLVDKPPDDENWAAVNDRLKRAIG